MKRDEKLIYLVNMMDEKKIMDKKNSGHIFSNSFEKKQKTLIQKVTDQEKAKDRLKTSTGKVVAAALIVLVGGTVTVGAAILSHVDGLLLNGEVQEVETETYLEIDESGETAVITEEYCANRISGYLSGTPEYKAVKEWKEFEDSYADLDNEVYAEHLDAYDESDSHEFDDYSAYSVIDQTMADQVDELLAKYQLKKEIEDSYIMNWNETDHYKDVYQEVLKKLDLKDFVTDKDVFQIATCSTYQSGDFDCDFYTQFDEAINKADSDYICQMSVTYNGVFNPHSLNLGDLSDYEEWEYTNKNGNQMTLMINHKTLVAYCFYIGENATVRVNFSDVFPKDIKVSDEQPASTGDAVGDEVIVYEASEEPYALTKEQLEKGADMFDFSQF